MRIGLILLPLSLCAAPALAQRAPEPQPQALQLPPDTAERVSNALQSMSKAVQDLAGNDDPAAAAKVQRQIAEAKPRIEQTIKALNQAMPEIAADLQRAHQALQRAIANMPDPNYPRR